MDILSFVCFPSLAGPAEFMFALGSGKTSFSEDEQCGDSQAMGADISDAKPVDMGGFGVDFVDDAT